MLSRLSMTIASAVSSHSYPSTKKLFSSVTHSSILTTSTNRLLNLNDMGPIPGAFKKRQRVGRGIGSNKGKTCGHGHQKSRSTPRAFEGGQTPLYKRLPKIGFHNHSEREFQVLNLDQVEQFVVMGRLTPKPDGLITMRDLLACGIITQVRDGVKLLSNNSRIMKTKIHLEVSYASSSAIKAVEKAGGTVTCVHFNTLALRALTKPFKFDILPRRARPVPRLMGHYLDCTRSGYLSPEIQLRNMKLFGAVTSEERYREEHDRFMNTKRRILWPEGLKGYNAPTHKQVHPKLKDAISDL